MCVHDFRHSNTRHLNTTPLSTRMSEFASPVWQTLSAEQMSKNVVHVRYGVWVYLWWKGNQTKNFTAHILELKSAHTNTQGDIDIEQIDSRAHTHTDWWFGMQRIKFNDTTIDLNNNNRNKAHSNTGVKEQQKQPIPIIITKKHHHHRQQQQQRDEQRQSKLQRQKYHIPYTI